MNEKMALKATSEDRAGDRKWLEEWAMAARTNAVPATRGRGAGWLARHMAGHPMLVALVAVMLGALLFALVSWFLF